jgi:hypothetical protein
MAQGVQPVSEPPKSYTARGGAASSTGARARVRAESATIAFGRPKAASMAGPSSRMKAPAARGSSAVIGEPCETKIGARVCVSIASLEQLSLQRRFSAAERSMQPHARRVARLEVPSRSMHPDALTLHRSLRSPGARLCATSARANCGCWPWPCCWRGRLSAVGFFADRLNRGLSRDATALLGGDAIVGSDKPAPDELVRRAAASGLLLATSASFPSMGRAPDELGGASRLVAVKAVSDAYPLRGQLRLKAAADAAERNLAGAPARGTVWVDAALLDSLQLQVGDDLLLGDAAFAITQIIVIEPDRGAGFMSFAPRVMLNQADLEQTGLIQPASRVSYRLALAAPAGREAALLDYVAWAEERIKSAPYRGVRVESMQSGRPEMRQTLDRAGKFLNLVRCCRRCWPRWRWASLARFRTTPPERAPCSACWACRRRASPAPIRWSSPGSAPSPARPAWRWALPCTMSSSGCWPGW